MLGRFIIGINCGTSLIFINSHFFINYKVKFLGVNSGIVPIYLTEIVPLHYRGMFSTLHQSLTTIGILFGHLLGFEQLLGTSKLWPLLFRNNNYCFVSYNF